MERDVVCGMQVDPAKAKWTSEHGGHTYYFCCSGCKTKFEAEPEKYLKPAAGSGQSAMIQVTRIPNPESRTPVEYTCPMHPEVRQIGPGSCHSLLGPGVSAVQDGGFLDPLGCAGFVDLILIRMTLTAWARMCRAR